jgi:hypothetical protein
MRDHNLKNYLNYPEQEKDTEATTVSLSHNEVR